jgi:hypothetical protein
VAPARLLEHLGVEPDGGEGLRTSWVICALIADGRQALGAHQGELLLGQLSARARAAPWPWR